MEVGKQKALKSIEKSLKIIDATSLLERVIAFAECTKKWEADNFRFIPNPETWFNQGRWDDDLSVFQKYEPKEIVY